MSLTLAELKAQAARILDNPALCARLLQLAKDTHMPAAVIADIEARLAACKGEKP